MFSGNILFLVSQVLYVFDVVFGILVFETVDLTFGGIYFL